METIKANSAFLCNYEVMNFLQQLKDNTQKKHKREGSLATVMYETVHYLQDTECKSQNAESIKKFLEVMKRFKLTKMEKLMMVNYPPRTELEIQLIVQESEERLSEEEVRSIIDLVKECLPTIACFISDMVGISPELVAKVEEPYEITEQYLQMHRYVAAVHLTIADLSLGTTINSLNAFVKIDAKRFPRTVQWIVGLLKEPYFKISVPGAQSLVSIVEADWERNKSKALFIFDIKLAFRF